MEQKTHTEAVPTELELRELIDAALTKMDEIAADRAVSFNRMNRERALLRRRFQFMTENGLDPDSVYDESDPAFGPLMMKVNYMSLDPNPLALNQAEADYQLANERYEQAKAEYDELVERFEASRRTH